MDLSHNPPISLPPLITSPTAGTKHKSRHTPTNSPKRAFKELRSRGPPAIPSVGSGKEPMTTRSRSKSTRLAPGAGKPIVPVTERRVHEDKTSPKLRTEAGEQKWEVAPDGGSAGREGRQFTVANVGNNGKIYLRPTVRPAHQRHPQPEFSFPATPPSTAGLEAALSSPRKLDVDVSSELHYSLWTPTPRPSPPSNRTQYFGNSSGNGAFPRHHRALSDSTIQDNGPARETDTGAFKIVISKPGDDSRPKTAEDANLDALLDVSIPSWRIGVPRFTSTGTPLIRGSSYAPSEVSGSYFDRSQNGVNFSIPALGSRRPSTLRIPQARLSRSTQPRSPKLDLSNTAHPLRLTYMSSRVVIEPRMYDDLTFKPACDDKCIVRYAPLTGAVTAATPPRLVAEITSPSFLDYELISDFFLTFRTFLEPSDLLRMLVARLKWAVARDDEAGMIVHVRAFVALRHWILNYFVDDFVVDYDLRKDFCSSLNDYVYDLAQDADAHKVQLKILNELMKCWRRVCAHYWDGPDFGENAGEHVPITPGGIAGNRDPNLDPTFWEQQELGPPRLDGLCVVPEATATSFYADVSRAGHIGDSIVQDRPATPENQVDGRAEEDFGPISPTSMSTLDVVSCSFPGKHIRPLPPNLAHPLGAHPVSSSSVYNQTASHVAPTPKALVGKRVRPTHTHQRNDSLPDSLREQSGDKMSHKDQEFMMTTPYGGSLVRGNVMPPSQAFVDVAYPSHNRVSRRQTTVFQPQGYNLHPQEGVADAMSGRGMKRLIGSVRRALSTRHQGAPLSHGALAGSSVFGGPGASASNRLPGTAVVPQSQVTGGGPRPPVRIDLLGAEVAEDFKRAVREDAAIEAEKWGLPMEPPKSAPLRATDVEYSAAYMESTTFDSLPQNQHARRASDTALSGGSKSILIVDGTMPLDTLALREGMPTASPSVESFADNLMSRFGSLTPPTTPPTQANEALRRSSHLLNENVQRTFAQTQLPAFIPDFDTLGRSSTLNSGPSRQNSRSRSQHGRRAPPVSAGIPRMHRRNRSTRTQQSLNSILHNRGASFSSDLLPPSTIESFDATSLSRSFLTDSDTYDAVPKPLRALRRRPGGDLRAATNVGDLDQQILRRSQSLGSLSMYTESVRTSQGYNARRNSLENVESIISGNTERGPRAFSVGQLAERSNKKPLSLCSTRSSKPIMRPSFEAEAKKLAQIPDDEDDGGVESALLKLEGKFEKRPSRGSSHGSPLSRDLERVHVDSFGISALSESVSPSSERIPMSTPTPLAQDDDQEQRQLGHGLALPPKSAARLQSFLSDASKESYSSIPLLDRGLTDDDRSKRTTRDWADRSILQDSDDETPHEAVTTRTVPGRSPGYLDLSFEMVHKTESMDRLESHAPPSHHEEHSFLDSDLSSELSDDSTDTRNPGNFVAEDAPRAVGGEQALPRNEVPAAVESELGVGVTHRPLTHDDLILKPLPPTPEASPAGLIDPLTQDEVLSSHHQDLRNARPQEAKKYSVHLPFILAFDSETLAQQFTLIEKDALNEIDWKELVDMEWKNTTNSDSRSWVDFLRNTDAHGVEVVIARFNLVVKWAISEIVLTKHIEERAKCIIKFIHIAAHCRKHRNFATMAQLTVALSSSEVSRLSRTWEHVKPSDMKTLGELESLVTPMRNFFNLRAEMESASDAKCIPFVGIYTHDLLYNGQRPAEIASSPTTAPLVNFERCRTGATVIKTLLRLLEASTQYDFQPIEGITERCLWIGALNDDEIRRHSESLE